MRLKKKVKLVKIQAYCILQLRKYHANLTQITYMTEEYMSLSPHLKKYAPIHNHITMCVMKIKNVVK